MGRKVCAFAGLGNPDAFFTTLTDIGALIAEKVSFGDHAVYDSSAIERIAGASVGAEVLITTAKDRVRLDNPVALPLPLWTLEVEMRITDGEEGLAEIILRALQL